MNDWPLELLGAHSDVRARIGWRGLSSDEYTNDGPYLIAGKHLLNGRIDWQACDHVSQWRYEESPEIALRVRDVVVSKDGTIGRVARVDALPGPATLNGTMMLVRPHPEDLDHRFLAHSLGGQAFQKLITDRISGSSIPHLFQRDLVKLELRIPPLEEQRRIAEILDTIDETIQATERVIAKLRRTEAAVLMERIDFRHNLTRLGNVCSLLQDGTHLPPPRTSAGPLLLSVQNLDDGQLRPSTRDTHVSETFWRSTRRVLPIKPGDVCLAVVGATLGKLGVVPPGLPLFTVQRSLTVLRADPMHMRTDYLYAVMRHVEFQRNLWQRANQTAQPGVYLGELREICVPSPPLDEQQRVTELLAAISEAIHAHEEQRAKLQHLRSGLAADLLSGLVRTAET